MEYQNSESYHVVGKTDEYIKVTERGTNNHVRWGGQYFRWWLEEQPHYISYTRYLQQRVPRRIARGRYPRSGPNLFPISPPL